MCYYDRFYPVEKGEITVDGYRIDLMDPNWLRGEVMGLINQEPVLFSGSIMENIRYGKPEATDEEVYQAARNANAYNFIQDFPDGFQTLLGERGVTVSGGQKQRKLRYGYLQYPTNNTYCSVIRHRNRSSPNKKSHCFNS